MAIIAVSHNPMVESRCLQHHQLQDLCLKLARTGRLPQNPHLEAKLPGAVGRDHRPMILTATLEAMVAIGGGTMVVVVAVVVVLTTTTMATVMMDIVGMLVGEMPTFRTGVPGLTSGCLCHL